MTHPSDKSARMCARATLDVVLPTVPHLGSNTSQKRLDIIYGRSKHRSDQLTVHTIISEFFTTALYPLRRACERTPKPLLHTGGAMRGAMPRVWTSSIVTLGLARSCRLVKDRKHKSWQFGRKLRYPPVNGHLVRLVHVGLFQQSVCELLSRQAAGSLKVRGRVVQCNRSHPLSKMLLERKA